MRLDLYHGTDYEIAKIIQQDEFKATISDEHWLGNGIYFFMDECLAKWWTTNPSKKYGTRINNPAIVQIATIIEREKVLDLRKLEDFERLIEWEQEFRQCVEEAVDEPVPWRKYRCALFDYIMESKDIEAIIGCFYLPKQPYITKDMLKFFKKLHIVYPEIQVCIKQESQAQVIKNKNVYQFK